MNVKCIPKDFESYTIEQLREAYEEGEKSKESINSFLASATYMKNNRLKEQQQQPKQPEPESSNSVQNNTS